MATAVETPTPAESKPSLPTDRSTSSAWWQEELPVQISDETKSLLIEYSKIPEDQLESHLLEARRKAWEYCPFPCIGLWLFLKLQLTKNKEFAEAVERTKHGDKLLDLGCAIGQDLRCLAHAGSPPDMLYGSDLVDKYFDAGRLLFNDADKGLSFRQANALDENSLKEWHGQFPMVTSNYVLHCFSIEDQEKYAALVFNLLSGKPNDLFFGRTGGTKLEARREIIHGGLRFFRHSESSFKEFWERMADKFGRKVKIETWIDDEMVFELPQDAKDRGIERVYNLVFSVRFD